MVNLVKMPRGFQLYVLDQESEFGIDPYHAIASAFALNEKLVYLYGQLNAKTYGRELYIRTGETLKDAGYTHFIYYSVKQRVALGGDPLHRLLPGFWLVTL